MSEQGNNDLCTPDWLWRRLWDHVGPIRLDPCSNKWSTVPAATMWMLPEHDGLAQPWLETTGGGLVFVNPPYGRGQLRKWSDKCIAEANRCVEVVLLVPCSPDTAWWQECRKTARSIAYLDRRVAFQGGKHGVGSFASALLYWGPRPFLFMDAFANLADVRFMK